ncbi:DNA polymerase III delta prime subunit [Gemmobacter caeni]|uniref:DNA polymerase III delta prime subunit n=1 Tax=Gemmobacter caeni TaxID=589035 RepID=A0A2T6BBQ2_9RHOB|nr:DNA polymerase III subunit delta' [Gemmobacter caeni]PTX53462.1 DNA polymerase III delta prime subunit [Gemmobacter caeni]TWJ05573.1 DNA polymerase III delta prime subunit [Gemmobacter caeni]
MPSVFLDDFPEPDRIEGAPHPRETAHLYGHAAAQADFLASYRAGRLHHAWLITGPRGLGKATLAWKLARFLLATPADDGGMFAPPPPETLDIPADHPVARRMAALSEPRLYLLRRGLNESEKAVAQDILVKEVRLLKEYFALSAADGGRRVAIVDSADDMNVSAANALLKLLEEPPGNVTFFLISHQPSRLLPTIRSRCRELRLSPLAAGDMAAALDQAGTAIDDAQAMAELAGGSVGEALRMIHLDGLELYGKLVTLLGALPRMDRPRLLTLAETGTGKGNEAKFDLMVSLIDLMLARLARAGTLGMTPPEAAQGEAALLARLSPDPWAARAWADLAQSLSARARRGKAVNLDPAALLMDMFLQIEQTAAMLAAR